MADADDEDPTILREAISDSWRRSSAAGVDPTGGTARPDRLRRARDARPLRGAPALRARAADPRVPVRDRRHGRLPDRRLRRRRHAAHDRGQHARPAQRRRRHELRRGHAVERGRRGHERDRHGARASTTRSRSSAPSTSADPVQRWTCSACPIHDPDTGEVIGVIDLTGRPLHRPPAFARRRHRHRPRRRGQPRARPAGARQPPVRPLRQPRLARPQRARHAVRPRDRRRPARLEGRRAGSRSRPAAARSRCPSGAPAVAEPVSPTLEAFVVHAVESKRVTSIAAPAGQAQLPRPRQGRSCTIDGQHHDAAPAPGRDPRAAVRAPGRDERRAAVRRPARRRRERLAASASRSAGCASSSAPGSTPTATASPATSRPTSAASRACSAAGDDPRGRRGLRRPDAARRSEAPGVVRQREHLDELAPPGGHDRRGSRGPVGLSAAPSRTTSAPGSDCSRSSSSATRADPSPPPAWASCGVQRSCNARVVHSSSEENAGDRSTPRSEHRACRAACDVAAGPRARRHPRRRGGGDARQERVDGLQPARQPVRRGRRRAPPRRPVPAQPELPRHGRRGVRPPRPLRRRRRPPRPHPQARLPRRAARQPTSRGPRARAPGDAQAPGHEPRDRRQRARARAGQGRARARATRGRRALRARRPQTLHARDHHRPARAARGAADASA